jgi:ABC-type lipoprotein release transport system permease subunit
MTDFVRRLGFDERLIIIPADTEIEVLVSSSVYDSVYGMTQAYFPEFKITGNSGYFKLVQGDLLEFDIRESNMLFNIETITEKLDSALVLLLDSEDVGFLVKAEREDLMSSYGLVGESKLLLTKKSYDESLAKLRSADLLISRTTDILQGLIQIGYQSTFYLLFFFVFVASSAAYLISERQKGYEITSRSRRLSFSLNPFVAALLYALFVILLYTFFPGSHLVEQNIFISTAFLALIVSQLSIVFFPRIFLEKKSQQHSLQLRSAMFMASSLACRNLRRRKLRTIFSLMTIIIFVFGFVTFTSVSPGYGLVSRSLGSVYPVDALLIRDELIDGSSSHFTPLPDFFISWLEKDTNITSISKKAENIPISISGDPLGTLYSTSGEEINVYGIMGIEPSLEANLTDLNGIIIKGEYLEDNDNNGILISSSLQERLDVDVGDKLYGFNRDFTIEGFFDRQVLETRKDIDGLQIIPKVIHYGGIAPCSPDETIIVTYNTAITLPKVTTSRVIVQLENSEAYSLLAEIIPLTRGYTVYISQQDSLKIQSLGNYVEEKGMGLIPLLILIVMLNITVSMMGSVRERRDEIASLSSIGLNPTHIAVLFIIEGLVIGLVGGGLGYLLGVAGYRIASETFLGTLIVREKVSAEWGLMAVLLSGLTSIVATLIPALRASTVVTPSLLRKWKLDDATKPREVGQPWIIDLPLKLKLRELDSFIDFTERRLRYNEYGWAVSEIKLQEEETETGPEKKLSFTLKLIEKQVYSKNTLIISRKKGNDYFDAKILCIPNKESERIVTETVSCIRKITFEWDAKTFEVATSLDPSLSRLYTLINAYNPTTLYTLSTKIDLDEKLDSLRKKVESEGLRTPRFEIVNVNPQNVKECIKCTEDVVSRADVVCISGETDTFTTSLALNAQKKGKIICYVIDPRSLEEREKDPFKNLKIITI